jgi:hypothetical protein
MYVLRPAIILNVQGSADGSGSRSGVFVFVFHL